MSQIATRNWSAALGSLCLGVFAIWVSFRAIAEIDCECNAVGTFRLPLAPVAPYLGPNGESQNGRFKASLRPSFPSFDLEVTRLSDSRIIVRIPGVTSNIGYGFSPDSMTFLYSFIANDQQREFRGLYSLAESRWVWRDESSVIGHVSGFSPHGHYLVSVGVGGNVPPLSTWIDLKVIKASEGAIHLSKTLIPFWGGSSQPMKLWWTNNFESLDDLFKRWPLPRPDHSVAGWGFGPDSEDRSFVYSVVKDWERADAEVVNLATKETIVSRSFSRPAFWRFSPCGDIFGIGATDSLGSTAVSLLRTVDGTSLPLPAGARMFSASVVVLNTEVANHTAVVNGMSYVLAPNTANQSCVSEVVWVDFSHRGAQRGTVDAPFRTLASGIDAVAEGGTVMIKAGVGAERITITKPLSLETAGGVVSIGR